MADNLLITYCPQCRERRSEKPGALYYNPRGLGRNFDMDCFVCQKVPNSVHADMAAYVRGQVSGEDVVQLFAQASLKAYLDIRKNEPDYVQVKVGACKDHEPNLLLLYLLSSPRAMITLDMLKLVSGK